MINSNRQYNVSPGGIFHTRKVDYSPETQRFLKELINESKLTMFQRKQLRESVSAGQPLPLPPKKTSRAPKAPEIEDIRHILMPRRRTKEQIEGSGAYERADDVRQQAKVDYCAEKKRLQDLMAFGKTIRNGETQNYPTKKPLFATRLTKKTTSTQKEPTQEDLYLSTMKEIDERLKFLQDMTRNGKGKDYEGIVHQEIAAKLRLVEELDSDFKNQVKKQYNELQDKKVSTSIIGNQL